VPAWETTTYLSWRFPALQGAERQQVFTIACQAEALATVARHVEGTDIIAVVPDNLPVIAGWDAELREADSRAFLQLELVHAAVRLALEKKYALLDRKFDAHSLEELRIAQAVQEGRAQWLTWQVARRLGTESVYALMAERWLHVPDPSPDPQHRAASQTALQQKNWAYLRGKSFFEALANGNMNDVERIALEQPPRLVEWLEQPALYEQHQLDGTADFRRVFAALAEHNGFPQRKAEQQPFTPNMIKQVAAMFQVEKRPEPFVAAWRDGRTLVWTDTGDAGKYVAASAVRFASEQAAQSYFGFAVDLQRKRDEFSGKPGPLPGRVVDSQYQELSWPGVVEGMRNDKTVALAAGAPAQKTTVVLCRCGSVVVEINWCGFAPDLNWAQQVIQTVSSAVSK
jgi:hypothetical protein